MLFRSFFRDVPPADRRLLKEDVTKDAVVDGWIRNLDYDNVLPLLAEVQGKIVADATLHLDKSGWQRHIGKVRVVIHPDYRHLGLGSRLVTEIVGIASDVGLDALDAEIVADQVPAVLAFEHLGFKKAATFPGHVKDLEGGIHDLVVMVYDLREAEEGP